MIEEKEIDFKEIEETLVRILKRRYSDPRKHSYDEFGEGIKIACPVCGDSHDNPNKKRGYVYQDSGMYHCFNCGIHVSIDEIIERFNETVSMENKISIRAANRKRKSTKKFLEAPLNIDRWAIPLSEFQKWYSTKPITKENSFIKKRLLWRFSDNLLLSKNEDRLYILNLVGRSDDPLLLGYQTRKLDRKFYNKNTLSDIYSNLGMDIPEEQEFKRLSELSLYYGLSMVNWQNPVTVFESALDSFWMTNSIATSSVTNNVNFLLDFENIRFMYDNDRAGIKKSIELLNMGISIFLWTKWIKEHRVNKPIKDFSDAVEWSYKNDPKSLKGISNYFSNQKSDLIWL